MNLVESLALKDDLVILGFGKEFICDLDFYLYVFTVDIENPFL